MNQDAVRIAAFGRSGSGKSSILDAIAAPARRLIVFDYLKGRGALQRQRRLKLTHVDTLTQLRGIVAKGYRTGFRIWYQPPVDALPAALHELAIFLWRVQQLGGALPVTLYVDELSDSFPVTALPANQRGFYRLCKAGRHMGVNLLCASQAPAQVNTEFRRNLNACYLFSLNIEADQQAIKALAGRQVAEFCRTVGPYRYMRLGEGGDISEGQTRR